jgi:hypothetical protein
MHFELDNRYYCPYRNIMNYFDTNESMFTVPLYNIMLIVVSANDGDFHSIARVMKYINIAELINHLNLHKLLFRSLSGVADRRAQP